MNYERLQELCKKEGCWLPEKHICLIEIARTQPWLRLAFTDYVQEKEILVKR